jgi:hypothetical protein
MSKDRNDRNLWQGSFALLLLFKKYGLSLHKIEVSPYLLTKSFLMP